MRTERGLCPPALSPHTAPMGKRARLGGEGDPRVGGRLVGLLGALLGVAGLFPAGAKAFDFADLVHQAQALAARPFKAQPRTPLIGDFSYDDYRSIHFRPTRTLWPDRRFHLQLFAPGYRFVRAVAIHVIAGRRDAPLPFRLTDFRFPHGLYPRVLPAHIGYAGFRLLYNGYHPGRSPVAENNQVIVFLGASYFRVKGAQEQFGLSARALAIDTIAPHPEQFPHFIAFWIKRPKPRATRITVYALLNGPSVAGAFRLRIRPGRAATVAVHSLLFLRRPVHELGLAPLSSMYMYDLCDRRPWAYLPPAVHDSEGFLLKTPHKTVWRQLANPRRVMQFVFPARHLEGFGLIQRDRDFFDYESASMRYQGRPSVWVEPKGRWGAGKATLIEIPTPNETNDNIVAFWQPAVMPVPGRPYPLDYRLLWNGNGPRESVVRIVHTFASARCLRQPVRFAVDFRGAGLGAEELGGRIRARVWGGPGARLSRIGLQDIGARTVQLTFTVRSLTRRAVRVRAALFSHKRPISEIWDYVVAHEEAPFRVPGSRR